MKMLKIKYIYIIEIKEAFSSLIINSTNQRGKSSELENMSIEINQTETQRERKKGRKIETKQSHQNYWSNICVG